MSDHIDKSVLRLFLIVFLISVSVLAYRINEYTPCKKVEFNILTDDHTEGVLIKFRDETANANTWEWDFGDSTKVETNKEILHSFKNPGEYNVTLKINGICEDIKQITIKEKPFIIDQTKLPVFSLPKSIKLGETLKVVDKTPNARTWEWRFGETEGVNSVKRTAEYVFEKGGLKTVALVVNGDLKHVKSKQIRVIDEKEDKKREAVDKVKRTVGRVIKDDPTVNALGEEGGGEVEVEEDEGPKSVPNISENEFKSKLNLVARKQLDPSVFKEYFCGDLNKQIIVNGESTKFLELCELIKSKNIKIKEVKLYKEDNNCIKDITIVRGKYIY